MQRKNLEYIGLKLGVFSTALACILCMIIGLVLMPGPITLTWVIAYIIVCLAMFKIEDNILTIVNNRRKELDTDNMPNPRDKK